MSPTVAHLAKARYSSHGKCYYQEAVQIQCTCDITTLILLRNLHCYERQQSNLLVAPMYIQETLMSQYTVVAQVNGNSISTLVRIV